jgi:hypothetical protein
MAEQSPMAVDRRPTVRILTGGFNGQKLEPILWGLEEEGIPADIQNSPEDGAVELAKQAAHMSPLNVGIGINGTEGKTVLHHRDLPGDRPLFALETNIATFAQLRLLGTNAARLVKGEPLLFDCEQFSSGEDNLATSVYDDALVERIVLDILATLPKREVRRWNS